MAPKGRGDVTAGSDWGFLSAHYPRSLKEVPAALEKKDSVDR